MHSKVLSMRPYHNYMYCSDICFPQNMLYTQLLLCLLGSLLRYLISSPPASPVLNAQRHCSPPLASLLQEHK
jgi:hypothetical protein